MGVHGTSHPPAPIVASGDKYNDSIIDENLTSAKNKGSSGPYRDHHMERQGLGFADHTPTSDDDSDSEDEEEPLIIQLMESMFTRKKTVHESEQMISTISVSEIRAEIRRLALKEKCRRADEARGKVFE